MNYSNYNMLKMKIVAALVTCEKEKESAGADLLLQAAALRQSKALQHRQLRQLPEACDRQEY